MHLSRGVKDVTRPHLIFVTIGSSGDFFPFLAVAKAMQTKGFTCTILGPEPFAGKALAEGVSFQSVMDSQSTKDFLQNPKLWNPRTGMLFMFETINGLTKTLVEKIGAIASSENAAIVTISGLIGSHIAKDYYNLPTFSLQLQPFSQPSYVQPSKDIPVLNLLMGMLGRTGRHWFFRQAFKHLQKILEPSIDFMQQLGLDPYEDFLGTDRYNVAQMLDLWPDWYCPAKSDWPQHSQRVGFIDYDGPDSKGDGEAWIESLGLEEFIENRAMVFAMGSAMYLDIDRQTRIFQDTAARLGRKAIMATPAIDGIRRVSNDFIQVEFTPFGQLFPHADLVIAHGGIGTVTRILKAGVPSIITPIAYDQFDNAFLLRRLGIADQLNHSSLSSKRLAQKVDKLLKRPNLTKKLDQVRELSQNNRGEIVAADRIEAFLRKM